jgi:sigma-B regulation protein RsbU (phosphoserine phosphatase)
LGVRQDSAYEEATVQLAPGDNLVLFTDGITESLSAAHEPFGDQRLDAALRIPADTAADRLRHVLMALQLFRARTPGSDDETCLVCRVAPPVPATAEPKIIRLESPD